MSKNKFLNLVKRLLLIFILPLLLVSGGCFGVADATLPSEQMSDREKLAVCEKKMNLRFPPETRLAHLKAEAGLDSNIELIVELNRAGWNEFKKNPVFQIEELKISVAKNRKFIDWSAFEQGGDAVQSYQLKNSNLNVLAERVGDDSNELERTFVYLFWHEL